MDSNYIKLAQIVQHMNKRFMCTDEIELLLDSGYEINYAVSMDSPFENYRGFTLLHFAVNLYNCEFGNIVEIASPLLKRNADFTRKDKRNFTPLRFAFEVFVDMYIVQIELLNDDNAYYNLKTFIQQLISAHLEFNNSINPYSDDGISHMHIACIFQRLDVVKLFLKSGVPVNEAISTGSRILPGFTCIHIAMMNKQKDMVHLLLEYGAEYNCLNAEQMSPLHLINEKNLSKDLFKKLNTQLNERESQKNEHILQLITHPSEDEFSPLYDIGLTRLHAFCIKNHSATELDDLEKVLRNKDNVNAAVNSDSPIWPGQVSLHFASHKNLQMVLLLLKNGANLMAKDENGVTPLDLCLENFEPSDIANILETQKNIKPINFQNGAPLVETLNAFEKPQVLREHLKTFDLKTTIPIDSPLWPGFSLLHIAVILSRGGDNTKVNLCLKYNADVTIQDINGMTALHLAFRKDKWSCIYVLLEACPDSCGNVMDHKNLSLFHVANIAGNIELVNSFLDSKLDPNVPIPEKLKFSHPNQGLVELPAGSTALHIAVALQNKNLARLLLSFKVDPFILDADNFTWIHRAFLNGFCYMFSNILWHRHPDALKSNPVAAGGLSHFHVASYIGTLEVIEALLPLTSNINEPITAELMKYYQNRYHPKLMISEQAPLHIALESSNKEIANFLFNSGADIEAKNSKGLSPLYIALLKRRRSFIETVASEWVKNKKWSDQNGITLLHLACASGKDSLVKTCLEMGEDVNKRINLDSPVWPGESPINVAWKSQKYTVVEYLLDHFVKSIDIPSDDWELHGLVKRQRIQIPKERLEINSEGLTVFHVSCVIDNPDLVEQLIKLGVDIDAQTDFLATSEAGYSPLHFAIKYGSGRVIETLLKHGADISLENSDGYTPVQLAVAEYSWNIQKKIFYSNLGIVLRLCNVNFKVKTTTGKTLIDLFMENERQQRSDFFKLLSRGAAEYISFSTMTSLVNDLVDKFSGDDFSSLLKYIPNLTDNDENGRNVFHYIFSLTEPLTNDSHVSNIESLVEQGCDLDHQDKRGETPLHCAAKQCSEKFEAFVLAGADVSITDIYGQTPYAVFFKNRKNFPSSRQRELPMLKHVRKIIASNIDRTLRGITQIHCDGTSVLMYEEYLDISEESLVLDSMKQIKITESFALSDVFDEKMVMEFPIMPSQQRKAILRYLKVSNVMQEQFPDWLPLYKMQVRRAKKREESFESTFTSLRYILDPRLPNHVLESILVCLSTRDWNNISRTAY